VIDYLSGQDGAILELTAVFCKKILFLIHIPINNTSFIDEASLVKMAGMDIDLVLFLKV